MMTIRRVKQLLPYIEAFAEGKTVQKYVTVEDDNGKVEGKWENMDYFPESLFNKDCITQLRIKPSSTYRPFKDAEECWNEMQKHEPFGWCKTEDGNYYPITSVAANDDFNSSFNDFTFADGSVFGLKE